MRSEPDDLLDEDRQLRNDLAALDPEYLRELGEVLSWSQEKRDEFSRKLVGHPDQEALATLLAMCDDNVIRLRVRRAIRDVKS